MSNETGKTDGSATERPPIELLESIMADMLDGKNVGPSEWGSTLKGFRKALDAARRANVWDVVDLAFGNIVSASVEMLVRSQIALRMGMARQEERKGAHQFPKVHEDAERVERVARFLLDSTVQYAKVRHVSSIVRRQGDPKIVDFEAAREKAAREKAACQKDDAGNAEKKA